MISKNVQNMIPKIQDFFVGQPITKAWLFGSCSRGEETTDSDIDIPELKPWIVKYLSE